ncbi:MAG: hypothetical protein BGO69_00465 [Bacteroidetes bacterium 46-16]|nr:MAG: hypothetical protein BGO69_00465 [Bacteroidetes bacterium 46-16]
MKPFFLFSLVALRFACLQAQTLDSADLRRIEQRRVFGMGYYRQPAGTGAYCSCADELAFVCASEHKRDSAFFFLNASIAYTGNERDVLTSIYDPYSIGNYPFMKWKERKEWKDYEKTVRENYLKLNSGLKQVQLAYDLLVAFGLDQSVRLYLMKIRSDSTGIKDASKIDSANLAFIKKVVKKYGFPGISIVGPKGYEAAFILCQHADEDLVFQKRILKDMEKLALSGDAKNEDIAYLADRIMIKEKGVQLYGTQYKSPGQPYPISDAAHVNQRRAAMGLGTLEDYQKGIVNYPGH